MTNQTIPKRSEVPEEMTWNLKDMFASDEAWMTEYELSLIHLSEPTRP